MLANAAAASRLLYTLLDDFLRRVLSIWLSSNCFVANDEGRHFTDLLQDHELVTGNLPDGWQQLM